MDFLQAIQDYGLATVLSGLFVFYTFEKFKEEKLSRQRLEMIVDRQQQKIDELNRDALEFSRRIIKELSEHNERMAEQSDKIIFVLDQNQKLMAKMNK
jgi:hypothetical protein